jgi:hypothetical protein
LIGASSQQQQQVHNDMHEEVDPLDGFTLVRSSSCAEEAEAEVKDHSSPQ